LKSHYTKDDVLKTEIMNRKDSSSKRSTTQPSSLSYIKSRSCGFNHVARSVLHSSRTKGENDSIQYFTT